MKFKLLISMVLFALAAGSCSHNTGTSISHSLQTENVQSSTRSLTVLAAPTDIWRDLADAVESDLNIKLEFDDSVATYQWENMVRTRLAIGDMPDIFRYHSGSLLYAISPAKNAIDLTDFPFADKLAEPFRNAVSRDGKVYGIPYDFSVDVYYWIYNKVTYDKLNLNPPDNWDEFMSNCEVIRSEGLEPITEAYSNAWRSQLVLLNDTYSIVSQAPDFAEDLSANRTRYSQEPAAVRSFEKVAQVGTYLNSDNKTLTSSEQYEKLKSGEINHALISANRRFQLLQENPEMSDIYGFFPQPGESVESSGFTVWLPLAAYIYKESPDISLAIEVFSYLMSEEGLKIVERNNLLTGLPFVLNDSSGLESNYQDVLLEEYIADERYSLAMEFLTPLKGQDSTSICMDVLDGLTDPLNGAKAYDSDIEKQAIDLQLPGW